MDCTQNSLSGIRQLSQETDQIPGRLTIQSRSGLIQEPLISEVISMRLLRAFFTNKSNWGLLASSTPIVKRFLAGREA